MSSYLLSSVSFNSVKCLTALLFSISFIWRIIEVVYKGAQVFMVPGIIFLLRRMVDMIGFVNVFAQPVFNFLLVADFWLNTGQI